MLLHNAFRTLRSREPGDTAFLPGANAKPPGVPMRISAG
jgi:hypothetical protein